MVNRSRIWERKHKYITVTMNSFMKINSLKKRKNQTSSQCIDSILENC